MIKWIDNISSVIGKLSAWLIVPLILLIGIDITLRKLFRISAEWILELEWHLFATILLFGGAYALLNQRHVRIDVFYEKYSPKTQLIIDILGYTLFLIPWCILVVTMSEYYAYSSLKINERSPNPGGLPFLFVIKYVVVVAFILLEVQGISELYKLFRNKKNKM